MDCNEQKLTEEEIGRLRGMIAEGMAGLQGKQPEKRGLNTPEGYRKREEALLL